MMAFLQETMRQKALSRQSCASILPSSIEPTRRANVLGIRNSLGPTLLGAQKCVSIENDCPDEHCFRLAARF